MRKIILISTGITFWFFIWINFPNSKVVDKIFTTIIFNVSIYGLIELIKINRMVCDFKKLMLNSPCCVRRDK